MAIATVAPAGGNKGCAGARPETEGTMRSKLFSASCMVAIAVIGAAPAHANPVGHGNMCGSPSSANPASMAPGNSATSPGSVHNEPATASVPGVSVNGGNGGAAYNTAQANNKVGATSQYDTSCAKVTANGTGTPIQTTPAGTEQMQVPNNSQATRTTEGVTSHMGKGAH